MLVNGRWDIVRTIGDGGMGRVHLARDRHQGGREVALKILKPDVLDAETVERFRDEFRSLSRLRHPNLAEVYDFGILESEKTPFLTLEHVAGRDLSSLPRAEARASFDELAVQCLRALDFIHGRSWRHNDIKPQNIMVSPPFHVKLLDFGLARRLGERAAPGTSGTLHYLAPEVLAGGASDGRADLYALGVVLYEVLSGRKPFDGSRPGDVVTAILAGNPPSPRAADSSLPPRWEALVVSLMQRHPEDRPPSAEAALALLNAGATPAWSLDTPETFAAWIASGPLVAREEAHGRIDVPVRHHLDGPSSSPTDPTRVLVLAGPAGSGKSRLGREVRQELQLDGQQTLEGRCDEGAGDALQPFTGLLQAARASRSLPARLRAALDQALGAPSGKSPRRDPSASRRARHATTTAPRLDSAELVSALGECIDHLAGERNGVLFLENLQWAATPAIALLEHLLLRDAASRWLIVATLRSDDDGAAGAGPIRRLLGRQRLATVALGPFDLEATTTLLSGTLPFAGRPGDLARRILDSTGGNPLHVEEVLKALFSGGHLERRDGAWSLASSAVGELPLPTTLAALVRRDFDSLPTDQSRAVRLLAVFGKPVLLDILARAQGLSPARTESIVKALQHRGLVAVDWTRGHVPFVSLLQSTTRAAVYAGLPIADRGRLHRKAALALEALGHITDEAAEDLGHHFEQAGMGRKALAYLTRAVERAAAVYDHRRKAGLLQRAIALVPAADRKRRLELLDALSVAVTVEVGDHRGGLEVSRKLLAEARRARSRSFEIRALRHEAWALAFLDRTEEALEVGRQALALARAARDRHEVAAVLSYLGVILVRSGDHRQGVASLEEALPIERAGGDPASLAWMMNNAALGHLVLGESERGAALLDEVLAVARQHDLRGVYHRYVSNLGTLRFDRGDLPGSVAAFEEGLAWSRRHAIFEAMTLQCESLGVARLHGGRPDLALALQSEAARCRALVAADDPAFMTLDLRGQCERELGRFDAAIATHTQMAETARACGNRVQEAYAAVSLATARLATGSLPEAVQEARHAGRLAADLGHARLAFLADCTLAQALARWTEAGLLTPGSSGTGTGAGSGGRVGSGGRLGTGERAGASGAGSIDALRQRITRADEKALRFHDRLERHRTLSRLALLAGETAAAETAARAGLEAARKGGFREAAWRLGLALGDVLQRRGLREEAEAAYHDAWAVIEESAEEIGEDGMKDEYLKQPERADAARLAGARPAMAGSAADTASRMLSTLFEVTQVINSIHDPEELLDKVMDLAIEMVGAERGLIFLFDDEGKDMEPVVARNVERQTIRDATHYSRSILRDAGRGQSILTHDAENDARFRDYRSVLRYHIRSLMCVPLNLRGRTIGTVYVDTRAPGALFTPESLRFLESFAAQAAIAVDNARLFERVRQENENLKAAVQERFGFENIVGRSPKMREVFGTLARVAPSPLPVVIRGESGTGKELVARAIHLNSPRRERPFCTENCAALPDTLLESELFGHVRGAFTGADSSRKGLFELADGGTLFLDEVGDMSLTLQSKLLRVLQNGEIRPVGSETSRKVSVRVVSATNRDLEAMVRQRTFREDLYYRLKGVSVTLPPLRDRREDVPLLVDHFLAKLARENGTPRLRVEPALLRELALRRWPGNVRELENTVYRLALFARGEMLTLDDARQDTGFTDESASVTVGEAASEPFSGPMTRTTLRKALATARGNRNEAARLLGVSRATFFRRLKELGGQEGSRAFRKPMTPRGVRPARQP